MFLFFQSSTAKTSVEKKKDELESYKGTSWQIQFFMAYILSDRPNNPSMDWLSNWVIVFILFFNRPGQSWLLEGFRLNKL